MGRKTHLKVGDSVIVKPNIKDPDFGIDIGGWQGRISEISAEDNLICIDWDSMTLKNTPPSVIEKSEEEGWGWHQMYLAATEVERAEPRDTEEAVAEVVDRLETSYGWSSLGEEGKRIQEVLADIDPEDEWEVLEAWETYLGQHLRFPFKAEVSEFQERGPLQSGDRVNVHRIVDTDERYGILVDIRHGREEYVFPLCDLEATGRKSTNYSSLRPYVVWFANR